MFYPWFPIVPFIPATNEKPPTLYALLNSKLNFDKETKVKISDLAKQGTSFVFNFDYPLSSKVDKNKFETMIINHFLMRRIGYDTFTAFQIALNVKMNEIMPFYNVLLNALNGWDLFKDGENIVRTQSDTRDTNTNNSSTQESSSSTNDSNISDLRYSDMPQNRINDVQNGSYLSEYNYNTNNNESVSNINSSSKDNTISNEKGNLTENISRTPSNKLDLYKSFINETNKIYTMIFKDLDELFYQLV